MGRGTTAPVTGLFDFDTGRLDGFIGRDGSVMTLGESLTGNLDSGSAVSMTSGTATNVISVQLPVGRWDVQGVVDFSLAAATTTLWKVGISGTSGAYDGTDQALNAPIAQTTATAIYQKETPVIPVTVAAADAPKTMYLVASATFSTGAVTAYGTIRARRAR